MVICLLAILKAGGCYVPLDPELSDHRLQRLAEGVDLVLTDRPTRFRGKTVDPSALTLDVVTPTVYVSPFQAAYVIYTSGSTGQPKGVINTHAGICNRPLWMQEAYELTSEDRVLQKTPFTFDVSVWEFFWPLIVGATLIMARPRQQGNPDYLSQIIRDERVTHLHFVPSMLDAYLETNPAFGSVKRFFAAASASPRTLPIVSLPRSAPSCITSTVRLRRRLMLLPGTVVTPPTPCRSVPLSPISRCIFLTKCLRKRITGSSTLQALVWLEGI